MRVLFLTYHFPEPDQPGAFRPWVEARLLRDMGCDVTVVTSAVHYMTGEDQRTTRHWCEEQRRDGLRVLRVWAPALHRVRISSRMANYMAYGIGAFLASLFHGGKADIIFAGTDPVSVGPVAYLLSCIKRARLVLDERDLYPETAIALGVLREGKVSRFVFHLQEFWRRRAAGILTATPGIARTLVSYGHRQEKIGVVLNADPFITSDDIPPGLAKPVNLHDLLDRSFVVAYSGGLGLNNDVGTLVAAAKKLRTESEIGILIIGEGECRSIYDDYCRQQGLDNVKMLGPMSRLTTRQTLASADICVCLYHPGDLFKGTLASKIFDYLGLGKPIVFAGSGDTAEILDQAGAAIVVPSADIEAVATAIRRLYLDSDLRFRLGESGKRWFQDNIGAESAVSTLRRLLDYPEQTESTIRGMRNGIS